MKVGFAGSGNMAAALARGLVRSRADAAEAEGMIFTDSGSGRARALADELAGEAASSLAEMADAADLVILAVKPAGLADAASALGGRARGLISVLGGTTVAELRNAFDGAPVVRTMPNLGVEVGRGVICHTPLADTDREAIDPGLELLARVAALYELPEEQMDAATAVMGCSLGWIGQACEAIADAGAEAGLGPELSDRLIRETAAATGELLLTRTPRELQIEVASPGGSTEAGLESLAADGAPAAYHAAVRASLGRMAGVR